MTDLDLGMNDHISAPLNWDGSRRYDRGKVLSAAQLDELTERYGRYLDMDGDGIPYRTIPATHATKGAFVTRGSSRDEYAVYTEDSTVYQRNMERLAHKFETAKKLVHAPYFYQPENRSSVGLLFFGTSTYAAEEAVEMLAADGMTVDAMRVRAFPFGPDFVEFVGSHEKVFVIEQNRDAQFKSLMMIELGVNPEKLLSVLNYDGTPITADFIFNQIKNCER
jgi:2-oxoglutarate ferredoxin oxidoreductase subunit alpha